MVKPITSSSDINFKFHSNIEPIIECIKFNFNKHIVDGNHTHFQKTFISYEEFKQYKIIHQNIRV